MRTTLDLVGIDGLDRFSIAKCYSEIAPIVSLMSSPSLWSNYLLVMISIVKNTGELMGNKMRMLPS